MNKTKIGFKILWEMILKIVFSSGATVTMGCSVAARIREYLEYGYKSTKNKIKVSTVYNCAT
jgi:hypothetical protein